MKNLYISLIALLFTASLSAQVDRSKMPEPGPAPKIDLGETKSFTLENGLKVFVVENHKLPRVAYSLVLDIDPVKEGDKVGAADLAGDLMMKGTENMSKEELNFAVDFIGARISTRATGMFGSSLTKHQTKLLELMSDVLMNPSFKQEELDKLKTQYVSGIQTEKDDPDAIASNVRRVLLYGEDHPYGEIMTEETVENITLEDVKSYYNTYFKPNVAYLAVVGDITVEEAKPLVKKYFGSWKKGEVPTYEYPMPSQPEGMQVVFVNKPGAVQSIVTVFNSLDLKPGAEDAIPASVANGILGGGFTSKLNLNLREQHAYTYGARSSLSTDEEVGSFVASAKVRNEVTDSALTEMMKEITAMRKGEVTEDELQTLKNYRTGTFSSSLESPQTKASFALNIERYGLDKDYYKTYLEKLAAVTLEDVNAMSKKYIRPENGYMLVVGNQEEVADKVRPFAKGGEMMILDNFGQPVQEQSLKAVPEGVTVNTVINAYLEAIGGEKNLSKVKSLKTEMSTTMQGMPISILIYNGENGEYRSELGSNGMVIQKRIYDGEKAQATSMQGSKMLGEEEVANLKYESIIFPEMFYGEEGYELELQGIEEDETSSYYVVDITKPNGESQTNYYDTETGLLMKSVSMIETPNGDIAQVSVYSDYKQTGKVILPYGLKQTVGPQNMDLKVEEYDVNSKLDSELFMIEEK